MHNTSRKSGYVYVLCNESNKIKIGRTTKPVEKRLRELQTGSSTQLSIYASRYFDDIVFAESRIHQVLDAYRSNNGEWFWITSASMHLVDIIFKKSIPTEAEQIHLEHLKLC